MNGKKKFLAMAVLCAVASVGFVLPASAEETMQHDLDEVIVEADRDALPGGFIANNDRVGILGNIKAIDVPFTQKKYTEKTIMTFYDPNQPLNGVLANSPSIRVGSPSPMYTDFSMRGVNMNASHYYINGIPNMFNQTRSIPTYVLSSVDIVSGPNTVLNGATFSNNGTNGNLIPRQALEDYKELMHHPDRIDDFCKSDDDFHELLMSSLPNKYLRSAYDRITGLNTRFRIMTGKVSMINQDQTCEEHLHILDAALNDNWDTAADALQHHLELARDKAEGVIKVIRLW